LQQYIVGLFKSGGDGGKRLQNALNGTWLGHPLHPMITDVPVGAWTCTAVLDAAGALSGNESLNSAADLTLVTGLAAGTGAALTGFTDWSDTFGKERSVGLLHGLMMVLTYTTYTVSLLARLGGARKTGVGLANLGYGFLAAGAYIGGDVVYDIGFGVNHSAFIHGPSDFTTVMSESDLEPGTLAQGDAGGTGVMLARQSGEIYALGDTCVHAGCSLSTGTLADRSVICPCHGSQFDLATGAVINGPATMPAPHYDVRVQDGMIQVKRA
ncbi:MAG: Rieske 2Fe-2S domain-containing protein, partial [Chloroflexota bacterium]